MICPCPERHNVVARAPQCRPGGSTDLHALFVTVNIGSKKTEVVTKKQKKLQSGKSRCVHDCHTFWSSTRPSYDTAVIIRGDSPAPPRIAVAIDIAGAPPRRPRPGHALPACIGGAEQCGVKRVQHAFQRVARQRRAATAGIDCRASKQGQGVRMQLRPQKRGWPS
jgi:hypothetical protein